MQEKYVSPDERGLAPLVSVIVRSTGRAELRDALDSVSAQTYANIEILLVDARGDRDLPYLETLDRFPFAIASQGRALSRGAAANLGLDKARGDYLIFLDDDDWLDPDHIAGLLGLLEESPAPVAAYAGVRCVQRAPDGSWDRVQVYNDPYDPTRLLMENYIPIHALLMRRQALSGEAPCRFDEKMDLYEDWDFWLQLRSRGPFLHRPVLSASYRIHDGGGLGVAADEERALEALRYLVAKWRTRWSVRELMDMIAWARHVHRLLQTTEQARAEAAETIQTLEQVRTQSDRLAEETRDELTRAQRELERLGGELDARGQEVARVDREWRARYELMTGSRSWRLTAPLRTASRWQRKMHDRWSGALARQLWRAGTFIYRGPGGRILTRLPFGLKQTIRRWLQQGLTRAPSATAAVRPLTDRPLVSILVPIYNHSEFLDKCLRSALDQTYPELEVVAVDDASTDPRVREILNGLAGHPRLKVVKQPDNLGISQTQNRALIESKGDIIGFLDCDDYLRPDAVELCLGAWGEETRYLHSGRINVDRNDQEVSRISFEHLPRQDYFAENLERMYATHFKLISREVFARVGLFDPRFDAAQDYDLLMRAAFHYPTTAFNHLPEFVYFHRLHERQTTETATTHQDESTKRIQDEARLRQAIREGRYQRFLSIIMLSFGKQRQTLAALESLRDTVRVPHEIILFDNGSDAQTVSFLRDHVEGRFPTLRLIYHPENLGPAAGRREALKQARGDWFLIFDNDERAEPGWLEELLIRAHSQPDVGAVCCKVVFPNRRLQFSGGFIRKLDEELIELGLHDRDREVDELATAVFRECDWCPIGATLFTVNPAPFLHEGYPNAFEDAGVSMALRREGLRLLNSPASWVWHEHFLFQKELQMKDRYLRSRYDPRAMLTSIASFYEENALIIQDEYVWRENNLFALGRAELKRRLTQQRKAS